MMGKGRRKKAELGGSTSREWGINGPSMEGGKMSCLPAKHSNKGGANQIRGG